MAPGGNIYIVAPMAHDDTIDVVAPVTPGGADFVVSSVIQLLVFYTVTCLLYIHHTLLGYICYYSSTHSAQ